MPSDRTTALLAATFAVLAAAPSVSAGPLPWEERAIGAHVERDDQVGTHDAAGLK